MWLHVAAYEQRAAAPSGAHLQDILVLQISVVDRMTANALYLLATRGGDLSVVAPIAALYPVTTVILALIIEHERLRGIQVAGLSFAVAALVLVSR